MDDEGFIPEDDSIFECLVNNDLTNRSDAFLEDSFSSLRGENPLNRTITSSPTPVSASTPSTKGSRRPARTSTNAPSAQKARLPCPQPDCDKTYANERTLKVHVRMHSMKNISTRLPKIEELKETAASLAKEVLQSFIEEAVSAEDSADLKQICEILVQNCDSELMRVAVELLCDKFYAMAKDQNVLLPSAMRSAVLVKTGKMLSDAEFRSFLKQEFTKVGKGEKLVNNLFCGSFVLKFFEKLLAFVFRRLQGTESQLVPKRKIVDELKGPDFEQTLYHIVGAVIHGVFVKGRLYSESSTWKAYCDVLNSNCVQKPDLNNKCPESISAFSEAKDRGGYIHCNQQTFTFFYNLFALLLSLEQEDGSLPIDLVDKEVCDNDILIFLWDDLVGCDLTEEQSFDLLLMICHSCTKVVMKGIIKRRVNEEVKAAYNSVALRATLAK